MKRPLQLKVCGLTKQDQIEELIAMRIDFLGFIFYSKSPRYALNSLSMEDIAGIEHPGKTGVFVNENLDSVAETAEKSGLHFIQLHGDESEKYILELRNKIRPQTKIIKVFRISEKAESSVIEIQNFSSAIDYILFDTDSKAFGGTGKQFDWTILDTFKIRIPYFLSGGISEDNFDTIKQLKQQPFAIDINSKFEIEPGNKDIEKIKAFISNKL